MKKKANSTFLVLLLVGWLAAFAAQPLSAQEEESAAPAAEVVEKTFLDHYKAGGTFMHFLLLCSIGTIAVITVCFLQISGNKMAPDSMISTMTKNMQDKDVGNAYTLSQSSGNALGNVMSAALLKVNFDRELANKVSMEQAAAETLDQEETKSMLWVNYLNVFATIAPMIGLLGTVTGMIQSFDQLAAGKSEPSDLAGGIGVAMLTTAGGLIVGIPAMFFYFFFRNKLMGIMSKIQKSTTFLIDILSGEVKLSDQGTPEG